MDRKDFIKILAASAATGSLISFLGSCQKFDNTTSAPTVDFTMDLSSASNKALLISGGYMVINQVIIINNGGSYLALSDICTHQGCSLSYRSSVKQLQCPCHGGTYSLNGSVLSGPPPSSLKQYNITQSGNVLHIAG